MEDDVDAPVAPTLPEQMLGALEPADVLAIRWVLLEMAQDGNALLAVLALDQAVVEGAGNDMMMPRPFPKLERTMPCFDRCGCRDGEEYDVGFIKVRTVRRMPSYGLFVVESRPMDVRGVFEFLESAIEKLEPILAAPTKTPSEV